MPQTAKSSATRIKALVIEDSSEVRLALELGLTQEGWQVTTAMNGTDGISKFKLEGPDLVVLDLRMPGVDGSEICREIRRTSSIPIIVFSAVDDAEEVKRAIEAGATDFVLKSSGLTELTNRIQKRFIHTGVGQAGPDAEMDMPAGGLYVLALDPNTAAARAIATEVRKLGHTIDTPRPSERVETGGRRPDVVILDYAMPGRIGIDLVAEIADQPGQAPLGLIVAARPNPPMLRRRLRKCLMLDFIQKPWQPSELPLRLRTALDLYARRTMAA